MPPNAPDSVWVGTAEVPDRAPLRWQPPPPGRLARWHAKRRYGRELARGQRVSPSGGPLVVVGLLATLITICAIGGVLIGISSGVGSGSSPAPARTTPHPATTTHPGTHPAPRPTGKPTTGRPKPTGTHRS
jgi:hypothetical protein